MASGAKRMSKGQVVPEQLLLEAGTQDLTTRSGARDEVVSSTELPVPKQVEAATPTFPVVELKNLPSRDDCGSLLGQQTTNNQPTATNSLPVRAKGNAAKIFSAAIPRGKSLANFQTDSEDAQNDMKQGETLDLVGTKLSRLSDQQFLTTPSPFSTDHSRIELRGGSNETVHSVVLKIGTTESLVLEHLHPTHQTDRHNMAVKEEYKSSWQPQISVFLLEHYERKVETTLTVGDIRFDIKGNESKIATRFDKLMKRRIRVKQILVLKTADMNDSPSENNVYQWLKQQVLMMAIDFFLEQLSAQSEETQIMPNDGNMTTTKLQSVSETDAPNVVETENVQQSTPEKNASGQDFTQTNETGKTEIFKALQEKGGTHRVLAPVLAQFYNLNGIDFESEEYLSRWQILDSGGKLNATLSIPQIINYVTYIFWKANQELSIHYEKRQDIERHEIVRQLLLNVDEQLSEPGWLEEFNHLCKNAEALIAQMTVLPVEKHSQSSLVKIAQALYDVCKRKDQPTDDSARVDKEVMSQYIGDNPDYFDLSRWLNRENASEAKARKERRRISQLTQSKATEGVHQLCMTSDSSDEDTSKHQWVKEQVVSSDRLKLLAEKASLAEIVNESECGMFGNTPRKDRLASFAAGKSIAKMVCSKVSNSPIVIKCSSCVGDITHADHVRMCPRCQAPFHKECIEDSALHEVNEQSGHQIKRCAKCIIDLLIEGTNADSKQQNLAKLELGMHHNVQLMGILQRKENAGGFGTKDVNLYDSNEDFEDDTVDSQAHVSDSASIDILSGDSVRERHLAAAKQSGIGVVTFQEGIYFSDDLFEQHRARALSTNKRLEKDQIEQELEQQAQLELKLAQTKKAIRDANKAKALELEKNAVRAAKEAKALQRKQEADAEELIENAVRDALRERRKLKEDAEAAAKTKQLRKARLKRKDVLRQNIRRICVRHSYERAFEAFCRNAERSLRVNSLVNIRRRQVFRGYLDIWRYQVYRLGAQAVLTHLAEPKSPPQLNRKMSTKVLASKKHATPPEPADNDNWSESEESKGSRNDQQGNNQGDNDPSDSSSDSESSDGGGNGGGGGHSGGGDDSPSDPDDSKDESSDTESDEKDEFEELYQSIPEANLKSFTHKVLVLWIWGVDQHVQFKEARCWNNKAHFKRQVNLVSTQVRKLIWVAYLKYLKASEKCAEMDNCLWTNEDGSELFQASRMPRQVFASPHGVKHHLETYVGKTFKELGKLETRSQGKNTNVFSRTDAETFDKADVPYANKGMHSLIQHFLDEFSVDEFDLEEYHKTAVERKNMNAPTVKYTYFEWTNSDRRPLYCDDTNDCCRAWNCVANAYSTGAKLRHCDPCLRDDPELFEKTFEDRSDSTSVAGTSPPVSQALSEGSMSDRESVVSAQHNQLEAAQASLDALHEQLDPEAFIKHVINITGGCLNSCAGCTINCIQLGLLVAHRNMTGAKGDYDDNKNPSTFLEYEMQYLKTALLYRAHIYASLKDPRRDKDVEAVVSTLYQFLPGDGALALSDEMSEHRHYTEAAMQFAHVDRSQRGSRPYVRVDPFTFSKMETPHAKVSFGLTGGLGQTPQSNVPCNPSPAAMLTEDDGLIGLGRQTRSKAAPGLNGKDRLHKEFVEEHLLEIRKARDWSKIAGSGGSTTDEIGERKFYGLHHSEAVPSAVYGYKTNELKQHVTDVCKYINDKNLHIPLDRDKKAEWNSKMLPHWRKWPKMLRLLLPMNHERLTYLLNEGLQEKSTRQDYTAGTVGVDNDGTGCTRFDYCYSKQQRLSEWVVRTRPEIDKVLKLLMKDIWNNSARRALERFKERTCSQEDAIEASDNVFRITNQFFKSMSEVERASAELNTSGRTDKLSLVRNFNQWKLFWNKPYLLVMDQLFELIMIIQQLCSLKWSERKFAGEQMRDKVMVQVRDDIKRHKFMEESPSNSPKKRYFELLAPYVAEIDAQDNRQGINPDGSDDGWGMIQCVTSSGGIVSIKVNFYERMILEFARFQEDPQQQELREKAWPKKGDQKSNKQESKGSKPQAKSSDLKQKFAEDKAALDKTAGKIRKPPAGSKGRAKWGPYLWKERRIQSQQNGDGEITSLTDDMMDTEDLNAEYVYHVNLLARYGVPGFNKQPSDVSDADIAKLKAQLGADLHEICTKCFKTGHIKRDCTATVATDETTLAENERKAKIIYGAMRRRRNRTAGSYVSYGKKQSSPDRSGTTTRGTGRAKGQGKGKGKGRGRGKGKGRGKGSGETFKTQALSPAEYVAAEPKKSINDLEADALIGKEAFHNGDYVVAANALVQRMKAHLPDALTAIKEKRSIDPSQFKQWMLWTFPTDYWSMNEQQTPRSCVHSTTKGLVLKGAPQEWELLLNEICKRVSVDSSLFEEGYSLSRVQDFCHWWGERGNGARDTPPWLMDVVEKLSSIYPSDGVNRGTVYSMGNSHNKPVNQAQLSEGKCRTIQKSKLPSSEETATNKATWDGMVDKCVKHCHKPGRNGGNKGPFDYQELHNGKKQPEVSKEIRNFVTQSFSHPAEADMSTSAKFKTWRVQWLNDHPFPVDDRGRGQYSENFELWREQWLDAATEFFTTNPSLLEEAQVNSAFLDERINEQETNPYYCLGESDEEVEVAVNSTFQACLVESLPTEKSIEVLARSAGPTGPLSDYGNNIKYTIDKFRVPTTATVHQIRDELRRHIEQDFGDEIPGHIYLHIEPHDDSGRMNRLPFGDGRGTVSLDSGKKVMPTGTTRIYVETAIQCGSEGGMQGSSDSHQKQPTPVNDHNDHDVSQASEGGGINGKPEQQSPKISTAASLHLGSSQAPSSPVTHTETNSSCNNNSSAGTSDPRWQFNYMGQSGQGALTAVEATMTNTGSSSTPSVTSRRDLPSLRTFEEQKQQRDDSPQYNPDHSGSDTDRSDSERTILQGSHPRSSSQQHGRRQRSRSRDGKRNYTLYSEQGVTHSSYSNSNQFANEQRHYQQLTQAGRGGGEQSHWYQDVTSQNRLKPLAIGIPHCHEMNKTKQYLWNLSSAMETTVHQQLDYHLSSNPSLQTTQGRLAAFNQLVMETCQNQGYEYVKRCIFKKVHGADGREVIGIAFLDKHFGQWHIESKATQSYTCALGTFKVINDARSSSSVSSGKKTRERHKLISLTTEAIVASAKLEELDTSHCYNTRAHYTNNRNPFEWNTQRQRFKNTRLYTSKVHAETENHRVINLQRAIVSLQAQLLVQEEALDTVALILMRAANTPMLTFNLLTLDTHDYASSVIRREPVIRIPFQGTVREGVPSPADCENGYRPCTLDECVKAMYEAMTDTDYNRSDFGLDLNIPYAKRWHVNGMVGDDSRHVRPTLLCNLIRRLVETGSCMKDLTPHGVASSMRATSHYDSMDDEARKRMDDDRENGLIRFEDLTQYDLTEAYLRCTSVSKFDQKAMGDLAAAGYTKESPYARMENDPVWMEMVRVLSNKRDIPAPINEQLLYRTLVASGLLLSTTQITAYCPAVYGVVNQVDSERFGRTLQDLKGQKSDQTPTFLVQLLKLIATSEDRLSPMSTVSHTIKHDLLKGGHDGDPENWDMGKMFMAQELIDIWIQQRAATTNGIAAELSRNIGHLESLQDRASTQKHSQDTEAPVDCEKIQSVLLSANTCLVTYYQSLGQTYLGHEESSVSLRHRQDQHQRTLHTINWNFRTMKPKVNLDHNTALDDFVDVPRIYLAQFSSIRILRTLETMIRSLIWNRSNPSLIKAGDLRRASNAASTPVVHFACEQAFDEIRLLLTLYTTWHDLYATYIQRSRRFKTQPGTTIAEARNSYKNVAKRKRSGIDPSSLDHGDALSAHYGDRRTFIHGIADDISRKLLLQTVGHTVDVVTDPLMYELVGEQEQRNHRLRPSQFVQSKIVLGSTVYVTSLPTNDQYGHTMVVQQLGNEQFRHKLPEGWEETGKYIKRYSLLPGVLHRKMYMNFCLQKRQHRFCELALFSQPWRESHSKSILSRYPMLPSSLAVTNEALSQELLKKVDLFVNDLSGWKSTFKLGFPTRNETQMNAVKELLASNIPIQQNYYPTNYSEGHLEQAQDVDGDLFSPAAPAALCEQLCEVPTTIRLTLEVAVKEHQQKFHEIATIDDLESKTEATKQQMRENRTKRELEAEKERNTKLTNQAAQRVASKGKESSASTASTVRENLHVSDKYTSSAHRLVRLRQTTVKTLETRLHHHESMTTATVHERKVEYKNPEPSLETAFPESLVQQLTEDSLPTSLMNLMSSTDKRDQAEVVSLINTRNRNENRHYGSTMCLNCGFCLPRVKYTKDCTVYVNDLGGSTLIKVDQRQDARTVFCHECEGSGRTHVHGQQVLSFRHHALLKFGLTGIKACLCGDFHNENQLEVVEDIDVILKSKLDELEIDTRQTLKRDLLVLYCCAAKMFYPICLYKPSEPIIKRVVIEDSEWVSYLLFQCNNEAVDKGPSHFFDSPGHYRPSVTDVKVPFCTTCFRSGHNHGCELDRHRRSDVETDDSNAGHHKRELVKLLTEFTYKPEKLGPNFPKSARPDNRTPNRNENRGRDRHRGRERNRDRTPSHRNTEGRQRDRDRTPSHRDNNMDRQPYRSRSRGRPSHYSGYGGGMTLKEYANKWGGCSLPTILGLVFDHDGWVENHNHTEVINQLHHGHNESGWSLYTVLLKSVLPYDRGANTHTHNSSHTTQHTQEGLHLTTGLAEARDDQTENSTVSPTCSILRTNSPRLRSLRQRLRRTILKNRKRVMCELRSITNIINSTSTTTSIPESSDSPLRSQLLSETLEPKIAVHRRATPDRITEYNRWVDNYNKTHRTSDETSQFDEWEFDDSPFAELRKEWSCETMRELDRPQLVHVNALHQSKVQVGSMHLSSVPMQPQEIGRLSQLNLRPHLMQSSQEKRFRAVHRRISQPIGGATEGLAWPSMRTRCIADDGSIMLVLDSGAEANVLNELALIPEPTDHPMRLVSFNGHSTICPHTGECVVGSKDHQGNMIALNLGWSGYRESSRTQDNLLSVPVLRKLGWQFWFGDHPYAVDPTGREILLYANHRGYLALRVHAAEAARINAVEHVVDEPRQIGYLSNDWNLWHSRMAHQGDAVLNHMIKYEQASGIPQLKHYKSAGSKCLSCEIGKSTMKHVGDARYTDKVKMNKATADKALEEDTKYYPLQQVHLDCCDMCTPDIHGNNQFLIIVDRATKYVWLRPFDSREDGAIVDIVEEWITDVVRPYHAHRINHRILEDDKLTTLKYRYNETDKRERLKLLLNDKSLIVQDLLSGLKLIRTDSGTEFLNKKMKLMLAKHKISHRTTAREVKDATAEAHIRRVTTLTRTCLIAAGLKKCFWSGLADMVVHTLNRSHNSSINGVPYSEMFGLKPNLSYLRQPGCIALCHRMDQQRKIKADERAFVGTLVGYDTTSRSWLFFNPTTGREVRTIHATFHERPREAHEHVDMDHMLLSEPKWNSTMKEHGWRCQLWPDVLWPGMRNDKLGNTAEEFPPGCYTLTGLNPELVTFDEASRPEVTDSESSSDEEESSDSSDQDDSNDDDKHLSPVLPELPHKNQGVNSGGGIVQDIFIPNNIILRGQRRARKKYMRDRVDLISGNRIKDIFDTTKSKSSPNFPVTQVPIDDVGATGLYLTKDFQYDLAMDFIQLENGISSTQPEETDHETEEEKNDTPEPISSPTPKRLRRSTRTRGTKRTQRVIHVNGVAMDVDRNYNAHEFDKYLGLPPIPREQHQCTQMVTHETVWKQSSTPLNINVAHLNMVCGSSHSKLTIPEHDTKWRGFLDPKKPLYLRNKTGVIEEHEGVWPAQFVNESRVADVEGTAYGVFPTQEELDGYRGNGLYADSNGIIKPSSIVRTVQQMYNESTQYVYNLGKRFVMDVPSPSELNDPSPEDWFEYEVQSHTVVNDKGQDEVIELKVPKGTRQAFKHEYSPHWPNAIYKELIGLYNYGCFELEHSNHPEVYQHGTLPSHIVFTDKWTADVPEQFIKCKARLVAGGNFEPAPENAFENFSPTAGAIINRFFDAYCVYKGFKIYSTDCTQAFLNAPVFRPIFIRPPPGCCPQGYVWRLKKHLYGLCSSPAAWMNTLSEQLIKQGFQPFENDPCLMRKVDTETGDEVIISIFVDDIKWAGTNKRTIDKEIAALHAKYKMTPTSEVDTYLGMQYLYKTDTPGKFELHVNQTAYIRTLVKRFEMEDTSYFKKKSTPLPEFRSEADLESKYKVFFKNMQSDPVIALKQWARKFSFPMIIGSLIHAMVHTRPDISYAVSTLSRSMANPELYHYKAAQHVLSYLRDTDEIDLVYRQEIMLEQGSVLTAQTGEEYTSSSGKSAFDQFLRAAVDASFADCDKTYRSTSGFVLWFGGTAIDWECKRQPLVTLSTMESEFVAASKLVCSIRFIHKLLNFVELRRVGPTECHEDNAACIAVSMKPVHKQRSKHIGVKYMNVREATENGEVRLVSVKTQHQCADIFTKSLTKEKFERFRDTIRGVVTYKDMVMNEIASAEKSAKLKEEKGKSKSINLMTIKTAIEEIEDFELEFNNSWTTYTISSDHYSTINIVGKTNPLQSFQACIEGKASYAIPGYP